MSIENEISKLTKAIEANTAALLAYTSASPGTASTATATPSAEPAPAPVQAPVAEPAPPALAPTPAAPAPAPTPAPAPAAAPDAHTAESLNELCLAKYNVLGGTPDAAAKLVEVFKSFGSDKITHISPDKYAAVAAAVEALA